MIKDNNLVINQEARLGAIHKRKLQALVWWEKDYQQPGLEITVSAWTTEDLTSYIAQISIESTPGEDIKAEHPGKLEIGHKRKTWDVKWKNISAPWWEYWVVPWIM